MIPLESLYVKEIISVENQNLKDIISVQREHSGADGLLHSAGNRFECLTCLSESF